MTPWGAVTILATLWFLRIAWVDFWTLRIRNGEVIGLSLLLLAGLFVALGWDAWWWALAGVAMFALGFALWSLNMMGGGDAKLFLPIGLLLGWNGLLWFAVLLVPAALGTVFVMWLGRRLMPDASAVGRRLGEIKKIRGVPYAVPLVAAALGALAVV